MHFESKKKADNFIRFNAAEMFNNGQKSPVRSYYCQLCGAWHVTSNPSEEEGERLDMRDKKIAWHLGQKRLKDEDIALTLQALTEKTRDFNLQLGLCNFRQAKAVLDEIESEIPLHLRKKSQINKVNKFRAKICDYRKRLCKLAELYALTKDEQQSLIDSTEGLSTQEEVKADLKIVNSMKLVLEVFDYRDNLIACSDGPLVDEISKKCRLYIKQATKGTPQARMVLNKRLSEILHQRKNKKAMPNW